MHACGGQDYRESEVLDNQITKLCWVVTTYKVYSFWNANILRLNVHSSQKDHETDRTSVQDLVID